MKNIRIVLKGTTTVVKTLRDMGDYPMIITPMGDDPAEFDEQDIEVHPEDAQAMAKEALNNTIDQAIIDAGATARQQRVYTSNMALLNQYMIAKLIMIGKEQFGDDMDPELIDIAEATIAYTADNPMIFDLLGKTGIVAKANQLGHITASAVGPILQAAAAAASK